MAETQYVENRPPAYLQPYHENLAAFAQQLATQPYTPYGGQRIAGFNPMETAAFQGIASLGMAGAPDAFRQAQAAGGNYLGMAGGAGGMGYGDMRGIASLYQPQAQGAMGTAQGYAGQFGGIGNQAAGLGQQGQQGILGAGSQYGDVYNRAGQTQMWPDNYQRYMNPFMEQVTNIAAREAGNMGRRQLQEVGSQAANMGAFGGDRHALLEGDVMQNTRQQISDITQQGQAQAYAQGIGAFNADRAAQQQGLGLQMGALSGNVAAQQAGYGMGMQGLGMQGQMLGQGLGAMQFGQNFGLNATQAQQAALAQGNELYQSGLGQYGQAVGTMANLGGQSQAMAMDRLGAMQAAGTQQRALGQAMLDTGYQDYLRQQQYGMDRANFMAGILGGSPYVNQYSQFRTTQEQNPSLFNTMLGAGITGLSTYRGTQG